MDQEEETLCVCVCVCMCVCVCVCVCLTTRPQRLLQPWIRKRRHCVCGEQWVGWMRGGGGVGGGGAEVR